MKPHITVDRHGVWRLLEKRGGRRIVYWSRSRAAVFEVCAILVAARPAS
jgi:hypothetical protein